jgi:hypothetical protein
MNIFKLTILEPNICKYSESRIRLCEYLYEFLELDIEDGKVYYRFGGEFVCKKCKFTTRASVLHCLNTHKQYEFRIKKISMI